MRRQETQGVRAQHVLLLLIVGFVAVFLWTSGSGTTDSGDSHMVATQQRIIDALMRENERLGEGGVSAVGAAEQTSPKGDESCLNELLALQADNQYLRRSLDEAKAALAKASAALESMSSNPGAVVSTNDGARAHGQASEGPPQTCAGHKLEFLRWQTDSTGAEKKCPFNAENYENWTKMPPLCDYISIECLGRGNFRAAHVFGFGGPNLMIGIADTLMWEFVFARHKNFKHAVELGTMTGGTSLWFGMATRLRGGTLHTFDRSENRPPQIQRAWLDNMIYHKDDILTGVKPDDPSTHNRAVINVLDIGEPICGLFDNGDKKRETDNYARYMAVGSVLLLHDWEHLGLPKPHWEMTYSYVKDTLESLGFEKAYFDFAEHIGSSTRAFIRKTPGPI